MKYALLLVAMLAGCAASPQGCVIAHSPSVKIDGVVITPSRTTEVCAAYVEVKQ